MYEEEQLSNKSVLFNCCKNRNLKSKATQLTKEEKTMALIETVADHDYAEAVEVLSMEVANLNRELKEQKEINENLFCAIRNLTDAIRDQNELMIMARNNQ